MGDELVISAGVSRIGERSAVIHQEVRTAGSATTVVDADITFVLVDRATGRPVPIEGALRQWLETFAWDAAEPNAG